MQSKCFALELFFRESDPAKAGYPTLTRLHGKLSPGGPQVGEVTRLSI